MSTIKGLRTLVRLKARRAEQSEATLQDSIRALRGEEDAHAQAQSTEAEARNGEGAARDRLFSATGEGSRFLGCDAITLQMLLTEAEGRSADAARNTAQALDRVDAARGHVHACEVALRRAQQQLEATRERLEAAIAAADRAQEDAQDEEAEETAVARMLAASRDRKRAAMRADAQVPHGA
ncbi:type III secretion protein [Paracidovorax anthurii]|uniref:Type III secretion system (T3SS) protein HrpB7 n=1 Tax=Paracidovorax anthurii TaxID=78229 RepID=A0A328YYC2_9BURK|nr:type III secretion protein [Paracidovorax anthurii]RAR77815.1 type III secretion system (T3SS) protein HrpB7 [Paracidovorax anthurii]